MPTILNLIGVLLAGLIGGANSIKSMAAPLARDYLALLVRLAWQGTLIPIAIAVFGMIGGAAIGKEVAFWKGFWSQVIAFGGLMSFLYLGALFILATPIGALIGAALPDGQRPTRPTPPEVTWKSILLSPDWIVRLIRDFRQWGSDQLRDGVGRYFKIVQKVLAWELGICVFASAVPQTRSMIIILIIAAAFYALCQKFDGGTARLLRIATVLAVVGYAWWQLPTEVGVIKSTFTGWETWSIENWTTARFWIRATLVCLAIYAIMKSWKKSSAGTTGGSGHQTAAATVSAQGSSGQGSGWLGKAVMIACLALCLGMLTIMVMKAMELHERRKAYIEESMRQARTHEVERKAIHTISSLAAQVNGRAATAQATAPAPASAPEIWKGLLNPVKYSFVLSTNLSQRIPMPHDCSVRIGPSNLAHELWANGVLIPRTPGIPTELPDWTTYVQYRGTGPTPVNVVVGVGRKAG